MFYLQTGKKTAARGYRLLSLMLMLFVFAGNCSAAMMLPYVQDHEQQRETTPPDSGAHAGHCLQVQESTLLSETDEHCWDNHCPDSLSASNTKLNKLSKFDDSDSPLFVVASNLPGNVGSVSCIDPPLTASADFATPPLFYTLCVLRL